MFLWKAFVFLCFIGAAPLVANDWSEPSLFSSEMEDENFDQLVAKSFMPKYKKKKKKFTLENSWRPFWVNNDLIQPRTGYFFQMNLGLGLLRFSGIKGGTNRNIPQTNPVTSLKGRLNYTRTPLFEGNLGWQFMNFLALALAYQHQGVIDIQSDLQQPQVLADGTTVLRDQFTANLRLDALFAKIYVNLPNSLIWKTIAFNPYLALGFGIDWQTWSQLEVTSYSVVLNAPTVTNSQPLENKYSANAFYMFDLGLNIRKASPNIPFSVRVGCKYNGWGQARSMGLINQQKTNFALFKPIRIEMVYQFAPYLGVQWNY